MPRHAMIPDAPATPWRTEQVTPQDSMADAFTELRGPVSRYLLALGLKQTEAEEVVQETFLRLCQQVAAKAEPSNLRGWVFRVAHNLARDEHRRRRRQPAEPLGVSESVSPDPSATPEQQLIAGEDALRLMAALQRLPARQRECLHLRAEGLRYREIAEVLGAGVSTVAEWVQQGLKTLMRDCNDHK